MRMRSLLIASLALALPLASSDAQSKVSVGDRPTYTFEGPLLNGMGLTSLSELQGKPVFVEFWGTR